MIDRNKVKSSEFLVGYVYRCIENDSIRDTVVFADLTDEGYKNSVIFPKVWVSGEHNTSVSDVCFRNKMDQICDRVKKSFNSTFNPNDTEFLEIITSWGQDDCPSHVVIQYSVTPIRRKRMTLEQVEHELGYKIEIVLEGE